MKIVDCDILVVGSGGAALRAAIAAQEAAPELAVLVATKGKPGLSGVTANSCSDRMAFHATLPYTEPGTKDAWTYHADDIYRIGGKVSDKALADVLAHEAAAAFDYLDGLGVPFVKKDGKADQFVTDGSEYAPRSPLEFHRHALARLVSPLRQSRIDLVDQNSVSMPVNNKSVSTNVLHSVAPCPVLLLQSQLLLYRLLLP